MSSEEDKFGRLDTIITKDNNLTVDVTVDDTTDDSTPLISTYTYDAWGKISPIKDANGNTITDTSHIAILNPLRYRGYAYDNETGLYYLQSRYYDPQTGRFLNADETDYLGMTGTALSCNLFAYCENNSSNAIDPLGMDAIWLQDKNAVGGFGHTGLLIQNKKGVWYHFYWGNNGSGIFGKKGNYAECVKLSGFTYNNIKNLNKYLNDKKYYLGNYEKVIRFKGDFSKSIDYIKGITKKYNLLWDNCMQVSIDALLEGNFKYHNNSYKIFLIRLRMNPIPNVGFNRVVLFQNVVNVYIKTPKLLRWGGCASNSGGGYIMMKVLKFCLIIGFILTVMSGCFNVPKSKVEVLGNTVNNDYNNYISGGDLVRIENKIYYNYRRNEIEYGLIEISDTGSKRVYWDGPKFLDPNNTTKPIRKYKNKLLMYDNRVETFLSDESAFIKDNEFGRIEDISFLFQKYKNMLIYKEYNRYSTGSKIKSFDGEKSEILINKEITDFYVANDFIYYAIGSKNQKIRKYNLNTNEDVNIIDLKNHSVLRMYVENDYLILNCYDSIYTININDKNKRLTQVSDISGVNGSNVFNNYIFITSDNGIYKYDVITNAKIKLCDKFAKDCYIVDNKWLYFIGKESDLWRVEQDGGKLEKVYG